VFEDKKYMDLMMQGEGILPVPVDRLYRRET